MEIQDATVDVRGGFSPAGKFGLEAETGAFEEMAVVLDVRSSTPAKRVLRLVEHAERGCHAAQSLRAEVPVRVLARLNGKDLDGDDLDEDS